MIKLHKSITFKDYYLVYGEEGTRTVRTITELQKFAKSSENSDYINILNLCVHGSSLASDASFLSNSTYIHKDHLKNKPDWILTYLD